MKIKTACPFSNMDGEVLDMEVLPGNSPLGGNNSFADEECETSFDNYGYGEYSNASGIRGFAQRTRSNRQKYKDQRNRRKNIRTSSKAMARTQRTDAKVQQAHSQGKIADALANDNGTTINQASMPRTQKKVQISTMGWVGIGLGVAALIGTGIYLATRKK